MLKIIQNIDSKKASQQINAPVRIMRENKFTFSNILSEMVNFYIDNNTFPNGLQKRDIKSEFVKDDAFGKINYRPFSILLASSKAFEHCL